MSLSIFFEEIFEIVTWNDDHLHDCHDKLLQLQVCNIVIQINLKFNFNMQVDRFPGLFHHFSVDSFKLLAPLFATHSKHTQNKQTNKHLCRLLLSFSNWCRKSIEMQWENNNNSTQGKQNNGITINHFALWKGFSVYIKSH